MGVTNSKRVYGPEKPEAPAGAEGAPAGAEGAPGAEKAPEVKF